MPGKTKRKEPNPPDEELIRKALSGEQDAYQALLQRYQKAVFHIVVKIIRNSDDAQDLVQETFMRAFNTLESYRSEYRFSTWLCKIAANCSIDYLRKKKIKAYSMDKPYQTKNGAVEVELEDKGANPEEHFLRKQRIMSIEEAIKGLPPKYKQVIVYRHHDDKSYEEISRIMGIPIGTVKARIFRARELLKKKLKMA
ncbi:MAG: sigma-70 family RNA polymerase sigma factor [candidate division Zixibacteria bacterium]|nr:sigma-70 family RNA polymerase sigma factor [candidate division Zixibacteria bacterium]